MIRTPEDKPYVKIAQRHHKMDGIVARTGVNTEKVIKGYKEWFYKKTSHKSWKNKRETIRIGFDTKIMEV